MKWYWKALISLFVLLIMLAGVLAIFAGLALKFNSELEHIQMNQQRVDGALTAARAAGIVLGTLLFALVLTLVSRLGVKAVLNYWKPRRPHPIKNLSSRLHRERAYS